VNAEKFTKLYVFVQMSNIMLFKSAAHLYYFVCTFSSKTLLIANITVVIKMELEILAVTFNIASAVFAVHRKATPFCWKVARPYK